MRKDYLVFDMALSNRTVNIGLSTLLNPHSNIQASPPLFLGGLSPNAENTTPTVVQHEISSWLRLGATDIISTIDT